MRNTSHKNISEFLKLPYVHKSEKEKISYSPNSDLRNYPLLGWVEGYTLI